MAAYPDHTQREVLFREVQRFRQPWLWALLAIVVGLAWFAFIHELYSSLSPREESGEVLVAALVWVLVGLGIPALFVLCKLVIEVRRDGLYYRYHPFHSREHVIGWEKIKEAEARTYRPIVEYGGWGIRSAWRGKWGKAYNVYGDRGLQLELVDGKRILFGSQRADELAAAVRMAMQG